MLTVAAPEAVSTVQEMLAAGFDVVRQIEAMGKLRSSAGRPRGRPNCQTCSPMRKGAHSTTMPLVRV